MAINDVLPLKAAWHCAITNIACFLGPGHLRPNFDGCIYIRYAAPPYSALTEGARKIWCYFYPFVDRSSWNFGTLQKIPSYFPMPLSDCLHHVSFRRYLHYVSKSPKTEQMLIFGPQFSGGETSPTFYGRLLARFTVHCLAKCGWFPFADLRLRSLAIKLNAEFTEGG